VRRVTLVSWVLEEEGERANNKEEIHDTRTNQDRKTMTTNRLAAFRRSPGKKKKSDGSTVRIESSESGEVQKKGRSN